MLGELCNGVCTGTAEIADTSLPVVVVALVPSYIRSVDSENDLSTGRDGYFKILYGISLMGGSVSHPELTSMIHRIQDSCPARSSKATITSTC